MDEQLGYIRSIVEKHKNKENPSFLLGLEYQTPGGKFRKSVDAVFEHLKEDPSREDEVKELLGDKYNTWKREYEKRNPPPSPPKPEAPRRPLPTPPRPESPPPRPEPRPASPPPPTPAPHTIGYAPPPKRPGDGGTKVTRTITILILLVIAVVTGLIIIYLVGLIVSGIYIANRPTNRTIWYSWFIFL